MRIVLDENTSRQLASALQADGHEVLFIGSPERKGMKDLDIWSVSCNPRSVLITHDNHFANSRRFNPAWCLGILLLKPGDMTASEEITSARSFLDTHALSEFEGTLAILGPGGAGIGSHLEKRTSSEREL